MEMKGTEDSIRLAVETHQLAKDMHHRLFGNGQPGEIDKIHGRINRTETRVGKLENWRWWLMGIGLGIGIAFGAVGHKVIEGFIG